MKLLRDFLRLRTGGGFALCDRRAALRQPITVTVPAPRNQRNEQVPLPQAAGPR